MHYGLDNKGKSSYNWGKLDETLVILACKKTMKLNKILSAEEISQLLIAMEEKNSTYEKLRRMVLGCVKPRPRQRKPLAENLEGTLDYLYSMGIYRDWVMKQNTEEGIELQGKINERDVEAEASLQLGTRCSSRLNPTECKESENISGMETEDKPNISKDIEQLNLQGKA